MPKHRLNLDAIESDLANLQANFESINEAMSSSRDAMTDGIRNNLMAGYRYIDDALARGTDLLAVGNSEYLLELNTIVLCGSDYTRRMTYAGHIEATKAHFYTNHHAGIGGFMDWLQQQNRQNDIWRYAAGIYIWILSHPELYLEGNHRTATLIVSYVLAKEGKPPFALTTSNVQAYFEYSGIVKGTERHSIVMKFRLPGLRKRIAALFRNNANQDYLMTSNIR